MKNILILLIVLFSTDISSQYTQTEIDAFLNTATGTNAVGTEIIGNARYFYTNNYPNHPEGYINGGFSISATGSTWAMCAYPKIGSSTTQLYSSTEANGSGCTGSYNFGVALNGVKFGPSSAAFFEDGDGLEVQDWHLEALYFDSLNNDGDANDNIYGAHSTSGGLYHYHGDPVGYFAETVANGGLGIDGSSHSSIVGYAADGFPIYYKYVYANIDGTGGVVTVDSGYQLKTGSREGDGVSAPSGTYDGEYLEDYEYTVATKLDECNGRFAVTPEYPKGTYYYVITASWPVIPRCFAGAVLDNSFLIGPSAACGDSNASSDCSSEVSSSNTHTWTGETNTDWDTVTNWVDDEAPTSSGYVNIPNVTDESGNFPTINTNSTWVDLNIYPTAQLNLSSGKSLTLTGNLTNLGTFTLNSDATSSSSLLISGEASGNITYNRYLSSSNTSSEGWHLVASPVGDETIEDIIASGNLLTNGSSLYSFATYDNSSASSPWAYMNASSTGTIDAGKGYSLKRNGSGTISFTGTYRTSNLKDYDITVGSENSWNLVGNPFPYYISANNKTSTSANLLTANSAELDDSFVALYVWNSSTNSYETINHSSETAKYIAPGQAFFVYSKSGGGQIDIRQTMQSHQTDDLFLKSGSNKNKTPRIELFISNQNSTKSTEIKYLSEATINLDRGYDAGLFSATNSNFKIYSHLVSGENDVAYGLQCLPLDKYNEMIIPIGVDVEANETIDFTIDKENIPEDIKVYLEDKEAEIYFEFNDNQTNYSLVTNESINGNGRFYIHTTSETLSYQNLNVDKISIYKSEDVLKISGVDIGKINVSIYSSLGKRIQNHNLETKLANEIKLNMLAKGVYFVSLQSDSGNINKKIIID